MYVHGSTYIHIVTYFIKKENYYILVSLPDQKDVYCLFVQECSINVRYQKNPLITV